MQMLKADFPTRPIPFNIHPTARRIVFLLVAALCLFPFISAPVALCLGIIFTNTLGHPYMHLNARVTKILLQASVIGLGFGLNVNSALQAGKEGVLLTVASISGTLLMGFVLGKLLKIDGKISQLTSCGTAICGGSAIAAISPLIKANERQISISLGTVFILNSVALFLFPAIGHLLHLSQQQFGWWSAIAIHDTSSVVGAANKYGPQALEIATTIKLARALWIVPVSLVMSLMNEGDVGKIKVPWFIALFILAMIANTCLSGMQQVAPYLTSMAKAGLTLTLFLIGTGLSFSVIKVVGVKPLVQGIILWVLISGAALWVVMHWV
jgi:uncharacterized integral membrane protein (TIGR00698 family)